MLDVLDLISTSVPQVFSSQCLVLEPADDSPGRQRQDEDKRPGGSWPWLAAVILLREVALCLDSWWDNQKVDVPGFSRAQRTPPVPLSRPHLVIQQAVETEKIWQGRSVWLRLTRS